MKKNQTEAETRVSRVLSENVLTMAQAQRELSMVMKKRLDKSTLIRWIHRGVGGTRLDGVRIGNQIVTSTEAIHRFIMERNEKFASAS